MSLVPEKSIVISPSLAATIGLEETVLLQLLQECQCHRMAERRGQFDWVAIDCQQLQQLTPFWHNNDLQRLTRSLCDRVYCSPKANPRQPMDNSVLPLTNRPPSQFIRPSQRYVNRLPSNALRCVQWPAIGQSMEIRRSRSKATGDRVRTHFGNSVNWVQRVNFRCSKCLSLLPIGGTKMSLGRVGSQSF